MLGNMLWQLKSESLVMVLESLYSVVIGKANLDEDVVIFQPHKTIVGLLQIAKLVKAQVMLSRVIKARAKCLIMVDKTVIILKEVTILKFDVSLVAKSDTFLLLVHNEG